MSADFWAGYLSGAAGILIGNPLDLVKTRLQAGTQASTPAATISTPRSFKQHFENTGTLVRGATAPILGYGALNALLFVTYNRTLSLLQSTPSSPTTPPSFSTIYLAGAAGGLATFFVSAPTELIKCRAQVSTCPSTTSLTIARDIWRKEGVKGLYHGGGITSVRDAVGYGFYFLSYEWSKAALTSKDDTDGRAAVKVLLCGGFAGIVTWATIFPLDVVKTRVQTQVMQSEGGESETRSLLSGRTQGKRSDTFQIAREAYRSEGFGVFFRGLGICSVRAFVVNAVQWAIYEWTMRLLQQP